MRRFIPVLLLCALLCVPAYATDAVVTTEEDELNLREEASLDALVLDAAPKGTVVTILGNTSDGWYQVQYNGRIGYMSSTYLDISNEHTNVINILSVENSYGNAIICGTDVNFREGPSVYSAVKDCFTMGQRVYVVGLCGSWYEIKVDDRNAGFVYCDYVALDGTPTTLTLGSAILKDESNLYSEPTNAINYEYVTTEELSSDIVNVALQYIGVQYVWGGADPSGFDCSGFVQYVFNECGKTVGRTTYEQARCGTKVDKDDLQPGDILCFGNGESNIWHVGIYLGDDQFIHAPYSGATVCVQSLSGSYSGRLVMGRRI